MILGLLILAALAAFHLLRVRRNAGPPAEAPTEGRTADVVAPPTPAAPSPASPSTTGPVSVASARAIALVRDAYRDGGPAPVRVGEPASEERTLRLATHILDTSIASPFGSPVSPGSSAAADLPAARPSQTPTARDTIPWLVQFDGPIRPEARERLRAAGVEVRGYLPNNALLVEIAPASVREVAGMPGVRWMGEYIPEFKIQPVLRHAMERVPAPPAPALRLPVTIQTLAPEDAAAVALDVAQRGGVVHAAAAGRRWGLVRADLPAHSIPGIAGLGAVQWLEARLTPELVNDVAAGDALLNVTNAWYARGLSGSNQVIGHADTGLDIGGTNGLHADFAGRIRAAYALGRPGDWSDPHGHGTHTAGSILGDGTMSTGQFRGVAWGAQLVHQSVYDTGGGLGGLPADLNDLFRQAYDDRARIHSDSWGAPAYGQYTSDSQQCDEFMWDHPDMLLVIAAGNEGSDANADGKVDPRSMGAPGTAKSILTVGAAENHRAPGTGGYTSRSWGSLWYFDYPAEPVRSDLLSQPADGAHQGMAAFSSRGPTSDGRTKPDVVAPGINIVSTRSQKPGAGAGWGPHANPGYNFNGGTSMATPLAAGAAALAREYYGTHRGWTNPSAALIKATLLNGARSLSPGQYGTHDVTREIPAPPRPNSVEGWGQIDLDGTLFPPHPRALQFFDAAAPLVTGATNAHLIHLSSADPLSLTLAWADYPSSLAAGRKLVNDLDLALCGPGGEIWHPRGADGPDRTNTTETVEITPPLAGVYTALVAGASVPMGPQPYALVVHGALEAAPVIEHEPPGNTYLTDAPYVIAARVTGPLPFDTTTVRLFWNVTGSTDAFTQVAMAPEGADVFAAAIPAQPLGTVVRYYLAAGAGQLETRSPAGAPAALHEFAVTEAVDLMVAGWPSALAHADPGYGTHAVASGAVVRATAMAFSNVTDATRIACAGWTFSGGTPASGSSNAARVAVRGASTLTWQWVMQYALTQTGSVAGLLSTQTWWNAWNPAQTVAAPATGFVESVAHRFCGWYVDGARMPNATDVAANPAGPFMMLHPRTAVARYLPATRDDDADGLEDWWEEFHFGGLSAAHDADSDGDGYTNLVEFADRTDPRDAGSIPRPPSITHTPLADPQTSPPPWRVSARIVDNDAVESALLLWTCNGTGAQSVAMSYVATSDCYAATLRAPGVNGDRFEYRIKAVDRAGLVSVSGPYTVEPRYPVFRGATLAPGPYRVPDATVSNLSMTITNGGLAPLDWGLEPHHLFEDVEHGTGAWTHTGTMDSWHINASRWFSASNAWHFGNGPNGLYPDRAHAWLDSEPVVLSAPARLTFRHWASMEYDTDQNDDHYWDGGVVEISTNGGASFATMTPEGGYPHRITNNPDSPFAPETPCYGSTSGEWARAVFDLTPWTGREVRIRFRFGADWYTRAEGWYLDDIALSPASGRLDWIDTPATNGTVAPMSVETVSVNLDTHPLLPAESRTALLRLAHHAPEGPAGANYPVGLHNSTREIMVTHGPFGAVAPSGAVRVEADASPVFALTADPYCRVAAILTNGVPGGALEGLVRQTNWTWPSVQSNGALHVTFEQVMAAGLVPEWWLGRYGLTNDPPEVEARKDGDGDEMLAWQEWRANTIPTNAASVSLVLTGIRVGADVILEWLSYTNTAYGYEVWEASSPTDDYLPLQTNLPATPPVNLFTNPLPVDATRVYRIRVRRD